MGADYAHSVRSHAAVDDKLAPRDPCGLVRCEVEAPRDNIGRRSEPAERRRLEALLGDLRIGMAGLGHWRVDEAGMHRVHADLVGCVLDRCGLREQADRALGCVIGLSAIIAIARALRARSTLNENRMMRDYLRRIASDRNPDF